VFRRHAKLEHYRQYAGTWQASLGAIGAMAHRGEGWFGHVGRGDVNPVLSAGKSKKANKACALRLLLLVI